MLQHKHHRFVDKLVHTCFPIQGNPQLGLFMFDIAERNTHRERECECIHWWVCVCVCDTQVSRHIGIFPFIVSCKPTRGFETSSLSGSLPSHSVSLSLYNGCTSYTCFGRVKYMRPAPAPAPEPYIVGILECYIA